MILLHEVVQLKAKVFGSFRMHIVVVRTLERCVELCSWQFVSLGRLLLEGTQVIHLLHGLCRSFNLLFFLVFILIPFKIYKLSDPNCFLIVLNLLFFKIESTNDLLTILEGGSQDTKFCFSIDIC